MSNSKSINIPLLDSLRSIAAISVCLFHFICGPKGFVINETTRSIFEMGAYGVQFFFVISGFIIPWSLYHSNYKLKNYFLFLIKRFVRLEPPYILSIIVFFSVFLMRDYFTSIPSTKVFSVNQLVFHLGYLIPFTNYDWLLDVYWTLAVEFQYYIFIGFFYFFISSDKPKIRYLTYVLVFVISLIGTDRFFLFWLPIFFLGNLCFLFLTKKCSKKEFYIVLSFTFLFILFFMKVPVFVSSFLSTFAIIFFSNKKLFLFDQIGKISYSLYLMHAIIGVSMINVLSHHFHSNLAKVIIVLIALFVSIAFSYLTYFLVEKPSKRLSSKIKVN